MGRKNNCLIRNEKMKEMKKRENNQTVWFRLFYPSSACRTLTDDIWPSQGQLHRIKTPNPTKAFMFSIEGTSFVKLPVIFPE